MILWRRSLVPLRVLHSDAVFNTPRLSWKPFLATSPSLIPAEQSHGQLLAIEYKADSDRHDKSDSDDSIGSHNVDDTHELITIDTVDEGSFTTSYATIGSTVNIEQLVQIGGSIITPASELYEIHI